MNECLKRPNAVIEWMQQTARVLGHEQKPLIWHTPMGFRVKQWYMNTRTQRGNTILGERVCYVRWTAEEDTVDKGRQANGVSPNLSIALTLQSPNKRRVYAKEQGIRSWRWYTTASLHATTATSSAFSSAKPHPKSFNLIYFLILRMRSQHKPRRNFLTCPLTDRSIHLGCWVRNISSHNNDA